MVFDGLFAILLCSGAVLGAAWLVAGLVLGIGRKHDLFP